MKKYALAPLLTLFSLLGNALFAQQLSLVPTIHSIGYQVALSLGYDADSTASATVRYRADGQAWQPGFPATRVGGAFVGSLFQLQAATPYEVEVSVVDSFPVLKKEVRTAAIATREEPVVTATASVKWVSPAGSGTAYTASSPGNLKALLAAGLACGTTVLLKDGNYPLGDMTLNLMQDCGAASPIVIMAAPGETPVLDGGSYSTSTWYPATSDTNIWWTNLPADLEFNALCLVNGERMYPYAFLTPPADPSYPSLWTLGYGLSGFYRNKSNQVFVKTLDYKNPNGVQVIFSKQFSCLTVNGNHKTNRLQIKGIRFKYYSKGLCSKDFFGNPTECYPSRTLVFNDANLVTVDSCIFEYSNFPINFEGLCNDNVVQRCHIIDQTGYWSHAAFKQTRYVVAGLFDPSFGTYGRYLENAGIHFRPGTGQTIAGNIVRNNTVQGVVVGISFGLDNDRFITECDIYDNKISWCYDGIDALNNNRNTRIWGNEVHHCPVGTSLILPASGPVYIFRNVYHHLLQRQNHQKDPSFVDCNNTDSQQSWGTALKLNAGGTNAGPPGSIYFVHNTVHSTDLLGFNLYLWNPTWKTLRLRNNLFYAEGKANFFFDGVGGATGYSFESIGDNVVNAGGGALGLVRPLHGGSNTCEVYSNLTALSAGLASTTGSPRAFWQNGRSEMPHFVDAANDDYHLAQASPLLDKGVPVPGFNNDFKGAAPDIGAFEAIALPPKYTTISASICSGKTYVFNGQNLTTAGSYTAVLTAASGGDSIVTLALAVVAVEVGIMLNGATLTSQATNAAWQWLNCNGFAPVLDAVSAAYTPSANGFYAVQVMQNGCADTSICLNVTVVSTAEPSASAAWWLLPNPAADIVALVFAAETHEPCELQISDPSGKIYGRMSIPENTLHYPVVLGDLPPGILLFGVTNGREWSVKRLVKVGGR